MVKKLLIVDDEDGVIDILNFVINRLVPQEIKVHTAGSSQQALQLTETMSFDGAFVDFQLGNDSGLKLMPMLKEKIPALPMVMMSGSPDRDLGNRAMEKGALGFMKKPFAKEEVIHWLTEMKLIEK